MRTRTRGNMRRSGREEQTTHLTPQASRGVGDEWLQATLQGSRAQGDRGTPTTTPETSDATSSTRKIRQEASVHPQIGFIIGFHRVSNQSQASSPARPAQPNPGHARAACFVEEGKLKGPIGHHRGPCSLSEQSLLMRVQEWTDLGC